MEEVTLDENLTQEVEHEYAGFWIRFLASIIDALVLTPFTVLYLLVLFGINSLALTLIGIVLSACYKPFMEYKYGATLGKMAVGIKVISTDGGGLTLNQTLLRYIPWAIGNVISMVTFTMLHLSPALDSAEGFLEISQIMAEQGNNSLSSISSLVMLIAGLSIAFDSKKQGVHDRFASTLCVYK
jgi:uncharacterized RDD family membrane protein YckC